MRQATHHQNFNPTIWYLLNQLPYQTQKNLFIKVVDESFDDTSGWAVWAGKAENLGIAWLFYLNKHNLKISLQSFNQIKKLDHLISFIQPLGEENQLLFKYVTTLQGVKHQKRQKKVSVIFEDKKKANYYHSYYFKILLKYLKLIKMDDTANSILERKKLYQKVNQKNNSKTETKISVNHTNLL